MWKMRNEDKHGREAITRASAKTEQVRREVEMMYEMADSAPNDTSTDHIFKDDLITQLKKTTSELIAYVANWLPFLKDKAKEHKKRAQQQHHGFDQDRDNDTQRSASDETEVSSLDVVPGFY